MKKLAFEYAGSLNMPSMKIVKIEKENVMFSTPTSVYTHNGGNSFGSTAALDLALSSEIELASATADSPIVSA